MMGAVISSSEESERSSSSNSSDISSDDGFFGNDTSSDEEQSSHVTKILELEGILFSMGNPLLDISANVGKGYLSKYDLKPNDAILAEEKHKPIYNEIVEMFQVEYIPGGSTQNSIKVAQWMLKKPHCTTFVGCIGTDKYGDILKEKAEEIGVRTAYYRQSEEQTGLCAALICGKDRSLCADLAAANKYVVSHLKQEEIWALVEKANFYYIAGFFLTVSPDSIQAVAKHACENGKTFMMNLSAPFLVEFFSEPMMAAMPYVDILFGNETEAAAFATKHDFGIDDIKEIAKRIAALPKINSNKPRIVAITQGENETVVANGPHDIATYPVPLLAQDKIVDTNGAGDAFVGGYLAQLVQGHGIKKCVESGQYAASVVIQQSGCTFPETSTFQ